MSVEYEGKLLKYPKRLKDTISNLGGKQLYPETLFTRVMFDNEELKTKRSWIRLRTEAKGKITLTLKKVNSDTIEGVQEWEIEVDSFKKAKELMEQMGFKPRNFQESRRERWALDGVYIDFDTWPQYPRFVEIEGVSKTSVKNAMDKLNIPFDQLCFKNIDDLYKEIGIDIYNIDRLLFDK